MGTLLNSFDISTHQCQGCFAVIRGQSQLRRLSVNSDDQKATNEAACPLIVVLVQSQRGCRPQVDHSSCAHKCSTFSCPLGRLGVGQEVPDGLDQERLAKAKTKLCKPWYHGREQFPLHRPPKCDKQWGLPFPVARRIPRCPKLGI